MILRLRPSFAPRSSGFAQDDISTLRRQRGFTSQHPRRSVLFRIHVHRNAMHSLRRRREDIPASFLFHKRQKIILSFNLKLQLIYPFSKAKPRICADLTDSRNPCPSASIRGREVAQFHSAWTGKNARPHTIIAAPIRLLSHQQIA